MQKNVGGIEPIREVSPVQLITSPHSKQSVEPMWLDESKKNVRTKNKNGPITVLEEDDENAHSKSAEFKHSPPMSDPSVIRHAPPTPKNIKYSPTGRVVSPETNTQRISQVSLQMPEDKPPPVATTETVPPRRQSARVLGISRHNGEHGSGEVKVGATGHTFALDINSNRMSKDDILPETISATGQHVSAEVDPHRISVSNLEVSEVPPMNSSPHAAALAPPRLASTPMLVIPRDEKLDATVPDTISATGHHVSANVDPRRISVSNLDVSALTLDQKAAALLRGFNPKPVETATITVSPIPTATSVDEPTNEELEILHLRQSLQKVKDNISLQIDKSLNDLQTITQDMGWEEAVGEKMLSPPATQVWESVQDKNKDELDSEAAKLAKRICFEYRDKGSCRFEPKCRFNHSFPRKQCWNYNHGICKFGKYCRFMHDPSVAPPRYTAPLPTNNNNNNNNMSFPYGGGQVISNRDNTFPVYDNVRNSPPAYTPRLDNFYSKVGGNDIFTSNLMGTYDVTSNMMGTQSFDFMNFPAYGGGMNTDNFPARYTTRQRPATDFYPSLDNLERTATIPFRRPQTTFRRSATAASPIHEVNNYAYDSITGRNSGPYHMYGKDARPEFDDRENVQTPVRPCIQYQNEGTCKFGSRCRFKHIR